MLELPLCYYRTPPALESRSWISILMCLVMVEGLRYKCPFSSLCTCTAHNKSIFADCSGQGLNKTPEFPSDVTGINLARNNFSHIPQNLPQTLLYLEMSHNKLYKLDNASLAKYIHLRDFSISWNRLIEVQKGTFQNTSFLENLDISYNTILTIDVLFNISQDLKNSNIKTLNFEKLQCTYGVSQILTINHILNLKRTQLKELNLASNRINSLETGALASLPKSLLVLNLADNVLSYGLYIMEFAALHKLEVLNVSFQSTFHQVLMNRNFFDQCNDTRRKPNFDLYLHETCNSATSVDKVLPEMHDHFLTRDFNYTVYLPPNLRKFYFHDNLYKMSIPKFPLGPLANLTHVYGQRNIIYEVIGPVTGVDQIDYIDFSGNFCGFISKSFFKSFSGLKFLNISNNALGQVFENDKSGEILSAQTDLLTLDLSINRIYRLSEKVFLSNKKLERLYLHYNSLSKFQVRIGHMRNLILLDLSYNQLSGLESATREALTSISTSKLIQVNLMGNRLKCSCENLDFIRWMYSSKSLHFLYFENYTCAFGNFAEYPLNNTKNILEKLEKVCSSYTLTTIIVTSLIISAITVIASRIVYRYRWRLRYLYYVAKNKYTKEEDFQYFDSSSYRFDAFISYADEDRQFVIKLVKHLENEYKLQLCIHHRDFIPGTGIMDNITNAIHCSRRTVCIMTSHFLKSYWCMFELNMARMEAIYSRNGNNVLFLVVLEKNVLKMIPLHLMDLVESQSYIEYPEAEQEEEFVAFKSKLGETLKSRDTDI